MTVKHALVKYKTIEIELLLQDILSCSLEQLFLNIDKSLTQQQSLKLKNYAKQRGEGKPIAYILGYKYFYDLKFYVNKYVLVPRPESEWLVQKAVSIIHKSDKPLKILDIGTGSGCLTISIATNIHKNKAKFVASDISTQALNVAKKNANLHNTKIKFKQSNLFKNISDKFDLILANLPYVPLSDYKKLLGNLKFEPRNAITTNDETWEIYYQFLKQVKPHLNPNAKIILEIDPKQKTLLNKQVKSILPSAKIQFFGDIHKMWRYCIIEM